MFILVDVLAVVCTVCCWLGFNDANPESDEQFKVVMVYSCNAELNRSITNSGFSTVNQQFFAKTKLKEQLVRHFKDAVTKF